MRHFVFLETNIKTVISDPKTPQVIIFKSLAQLFF